MIARRVNLGRVVIVLGGLLVFAALASQFAGGDDPWLWAAVFAGGVLGFVTAILLGRWLGGWTAARLGHDVARGRRTGVAVVLVSLVAGRALYRWAAGV